MKRIFALLLTVLLLVLCGCDKKDDLIQFYYLRSEYIPGQTETIIAPEKREVTGNRNLSYILRLYLKGPVSEQYSSPFPEGLHLISASQEADVLAIDLSQEFSSLSGIEQSLAAGCIAETCFDLTDFRQIHIRWNSDGDRCTVILSRDSILLDDSIPTETPE